MVQASLGKKFVRPYLNGQAVHTCHPSDVMAGSVKEEARR
jgi:hypothetical protein